MPNLENLFLQRRQYVPAMLKKTPSRGWFIEYYIADSSDSQIKRKFIGLNCLAKRFKRNSSEFKAHANTIVTRINSEMSDCVYSINDGAVDRVKRNIMMVTALTGGITVKEESTKEIISTQKEEKLVPKQKPRQLIKKSNTEKIKAFRKLVKVGKSKVSRKEMPLGKVMEKYLSEKTRELRKDTLRSYSSFCKMFGDWCKKNVADIPMSMFDNEIIMRFMDYIYDERQVSARTYNNHLKMGRALFSWAKQKCYTENNPFENAKVKRTAEKKRIMVPAETRKEITNYFEKTNNLAMLTICRLVFASAIRPKEIRNIRVRDIMLNKKVIRIPAENAKNHHERYATINDQIFEDLLKMHLDNLPEDYYLVGKDLCPGSERCGDSKFTKEWDKMRKALNLPKEMQLYSLRDTGLNALLKSGVDPLTVMQHADHHDLAMTTRYANHADPNLSEKIYKSSLEF